jgi:cell division protein FtsB
MPKRTYSQMSRALEDQLKQNEKLRAENKANGAKVVKLKKMVVTGQEKLKGTCNSAQMTRQDASFLVLSALLTTLAPTGRIIRAAA